MADIVRRYTNITEKKNAKTYLIHEILKITVIFDILYNICWSIEISHTHYNNLMCPLKRNSFIKTLYTYLVFLFNFKIVFKVILHKRYSLSHFTHTLMLLYCSNKTITIYTLLLRIYNILHMYMWK